jgi:hypothetical protein
MGGGMDFHVITPQGSSELIMQVQGGVVVIVPPPDPPAAAPAAE